VAPPTTPDFTGSQGYRAAAPSGIDAIGVAGVPGGQGDNVSIIDIEYSWTRTHEDLSSASSASVYIANGTPTEPFGPDHGTAVLGELIATANGFGVTGIAPGAGIGVVNASNVERGYDLANSIDLAHSHLASGDVILVEQQASGPEGSFVPSEWNFAVWSAIVSATSDGVTVVEAAGNGGANLDNTQVYGTPFPSGRADSGAIIVGAGASPTCSSSPRSRLSFSTYGSRVNLQGWGECVATTGYGGLWGSTANDAYTQSFNGTSSASPIVAAAAAALSSRYEQVIGHPPPTSWVRDTLITTGTPQATSVSGHIGPLPNLKAALAAVPTDGAGPQVTSFTRGMLLAQLDASATVPISVTFAASDPSGVCSYSLSESTDGGAFQPVTLATPTTTGTTRFLAAQHRYVERLVATDCAGNQTTVTLPSFRVQLPSETVKAITYTGTWTISKQTGAVGGQTKSTTAKGASATYTASGTNYALVASKGPKQGAIKIYVDGSLKTTIDLGASTLTPRTVVWRQGFFTSTPPYPIAKTHVIKIMNVATSGRARFDLDAFAVLS
jgi:hypothetical protein